MSTYIHYTTNLNIKIGDEIDNREWKNSYYYEGKWNADAFTSLALDGIKAKIEVLKEYIFEFCRQEKFSDLPSRLRCIYMLEAQVDVMSILEKWGYAGKELNLLELEIIDGSVHYADPELLNCNTSTLGSWHDEYAFKYWSSTKSDSFSHYEILAIGKFRVKDSRIIKV